MITKCPHCETKFKVRDEYKGKNTKCPKCSHSFIIKQFDIKSTLPIGKSSIEEKEHEICTNCGREIPSSEQAYVFNREIVCAECSKKLRKPEIVSDNGKKKQSRVIIAIGFIIAVVGLISFLYSHFFGSKVNIVIREIPIVESPRNSENIVVSDDRKRVAILDRVKKMFVVDGVEGNKYDGLLLSDAGMLRNKFFLFSPDSQRYMYKVRRGKKDLVVIDGMEQKEYDSIDELTFSSDSKRTAYISKIGEMWRTVVDGIEGNVSEAYSRISNLVFSPTGQVVYSALSGRKWMMIIEGIKGKMYDNVQNGDPIFSYNGKRFAYAAKQGQKWLMVIDGVESDEFDRIGEATFSPDSKRVMFAAMKNNKHYVIIDGEIRTGYDAVDALTFSPNSERTAYVAKRGKKWFVVADGTEQGEYDGITDLAFSPDSSYLAYLVSRDEKGFLIMDGVEQRKYDGVHLLTLSPDGKRIAFCANTGRKEVKLEEEDYEMRSMPQVEGKDVFGFPNIKNKEEKFPNARGLEKLNKAAGKLIVVIDGKRKMKYDVVANLTFSPDSKRYVYWANRDKEWIILVNGVEGGKYDSLISPSPFDVSLRYYLAGRLIFYPGSKFVFDTPTTFHTLANKDGKIVRVEVDILD